MAPPLRSNRVALSSFSSRRIDWLTALWVLSSRAAQVKLRCASRPRRRAKGGKGGRPVAHADALISTLNLI